MTAARRRASQPGIPRGPGQTDRVSADPATRYPGESGEYRLARNRLLEAEVELRRAIERVAARRRALPPGGAVPEDYVFEEAVPGDGEVRFSELLAPGAGSVTGGRPSCQTAGSARRP